MLSKGVKREEKVTARLKDFVSSDTGTTDGICECVRSRGAHAALEVFMSNLTRHETAFSTVH